MFRPYTRCDYAIRTILRDFPIQVKEFVYVCLKHKCLKTNKRLIKIVVDRIDNENCNINMNGLYLFINHKEKRVSLIRLNENFGITMSEEGIIYRNPITRIIDVEMSDLTVLELK